MLKSGKCESVWDGIRVGVGLRWNADVDVESAVLGNKSAVLGCSIAFQHCKPFGDYLERFMGWI